MSPVGQQGNAGDHEEAIDGVEETAQAAVPVDGYPDASFTVSDHTESSHELL